MNTNIPSADNIAVDVIQSLTDNPNESGYSASTLKEAFDKDALNIKEYLKMLKTALDTKFSGILNAVYPIGSIYMSVNNTNPGTIFGGTWEQIQDKFLLSAGSTYTAGSTGGAATVTLTTNQIPAHTHGSKSLVGNLWNFAYQSSGMDVNCNGIISRRNLSETVGYATAGKTNKDGVVINATHEHSSVGGGQAHNNMPPYLTVYVWKRIS